MFFAPTLFFKVSRLFFTLDSVFFFAPFGNVFGTSPNFAGGLFCFMPFFFLARSFFEHFMPVPFVQTFPHPPPNTGLFPEVRLFP